MDRQRVIEGGFHPQRSDFDLADGRYRRSAEARDLADGLPLTARERSFAVRLSYGKVCPRLWKNASYEVDDGDAFLGADGGGVGRPTGACGLSEAIRF